MENVVTVSHCNFFFTKQKKKSQMGGIFENKILMMKNLVHRHFEGLCQLQHLFLACLPRATSLFLLSSKFMRRTIKYICILLACPPMLLLAATYLCNPHMKYLSVYPYVGTSAGYSKVYQNTLDFGWDPLRLFSGKSNKLKKIALQNIKYIMHICKYFDITVFRQKSKTCVWAKTNVFCFKENNAQH